MSAYPDWVMKHKGKGTYINKVGDKYYLYKAHSERIKGTGKVRRVSDGYLGRITEDGGLIPPKDKVNTPINIYEFGLSFAVVTITPDILKGLTKSYPKHGNIIYVCSVLCFIHGIFDEKLYKQSYLSLHFEKTDYPKVFSEAQLTGIERGTRMIKDAMVRHFGEDLVPLRAYFPAICLIGLNHKLYASEISPCAHELSIKHGIDWSLSKWQK